VSYIDNVIRRATEVQDEGWCVTIELKANRDCWVQFTSDVVNMAYPFSEEPAVKLGKLGLSIPSSLELTEWNPQNYATFDHLAEDLPELGKFVAGYLQRAFGVEDHEASFKEKGEFL
jgi:hypothetical protein